MNERPDNINKLKRIVIRKILRYFCSFSYRGSILRPLAYKSGRATATVSNYLLITHLIPIKMFVCQKIQKYRCGFFKLNELKHVLIIYMPHTKLTYINSISVISFVSYLQRHLDAINQVKTKILDAVSIRLGITELLFIALVGAYLKTNATPLPT